jgi:hypothetical protein
MSLHEQQKKGFGKKWMDSLENSHICKKGSIFCCACKPGANPTIAIYNASVVKFYNVTGSFARF